MRCHRIGAALLTGIFVSYESSKKHERDAILVSYLTTVYYVLKKAMPAGWKNILHKITLPNRV